MIVSLFNISSSNSTAMVDTDVDMVDTAATGRLLSMLCKVGLRWLNNCKLLGVLTT